MHCSLWFSNKCCELLGDFEISNVRALDAEISSLMTRLDSGIFQCLACDYQSKHRQSLQYHIESKHVNSPGHICQICNKVCPTKNALCLHRSRNHKNYDALLWESWVHKIHKNHTSLLVDLDAQVNSLLAKQLDGTWACTECGYKSNVKTNVKMHVESRHLVSEGFSCPTCQLLCPNRKSLRNHMTRKHNNQLSVNFCRWINFFSLELDFLVNSKMDKYSEGHGSGTVWRCTDCGYESKYKTNVSEHVESRHVQSAGAVCNYCSSVCVNRKALRNHVYKYHRNESKQDR